jgi:hypothetical protein
MGAERMAQAEREIITRRRVQNSRDPSFRFRNKVNIVNIECR